MAVEARHLSLFPSQLLANNNNNNNREIMTNGIESGATVYNAQMAAYGLPPMSGNNTSPVAPFPMYGSDGVSDCLQQLQQRAAVMKSESGLTINNVTPSLSRKRGRSDSVNPLMPYAMAQSNSRSCSLYSFLGEDLSLQIQKEQIDIDHLISQHMEKVRMEIEEKRKRQARGIVQRIEGELVKRLRAKEDEIDKIGKLNWALEERIKSLYMENQIWRDLAQANEATANALRTNLEAVLAQVNDERNAGEDEAGVNNNVVTTEDAESCCGSTGNDDENDDVGRTIAVSGAQDNKSSSSSSSKWCKSCGEVESSVLLLPCRHLCLCTLCGSSLHTCPLCNSAKTASVHVNLS